MAKKQNIHAGAPQQRAAVRVDAGDILVSLWSTHEGATWVENARLRNLSATGALIETAQPYPVAMQTRCVFSLPGAASLSLSAKTVRCKESPQSPDCFLVAVQFWTSPHTEKQLLRWIFARLASQSRFRR